MGEGFKRGYIQFGAITGLLGAIVFAMWVWPLHNHNISSEHRYSSELPKNKDNPNEVIDTSESVLTSNLDTPNHPNHPNYYEHKDLKAQEIMAEATEAIVLWTKISIAIGAIGIFGIFWTLYETRSTVGIMRQEQRPWVDFQVSHVGTVLVGNDPPPTVLINCSNVGKSIAVKGYIFCKFHDGSTSNIPEIKSRMINDYKSRKDTHGHSWIPNKQFPTNQITIVDNEVLFNEDGTPKTRVLIGLSVLIGYRAHGDSITHFTFKNFELFKYDGFDHSVGTLNEVVTTYDSIQEDEYRTEYI